MFFGPDLSAAMTVLRDRYQQHAEFSDGERREAMRDLVRLAREVGCDDDRLRMIVELTCCGPGVPPHFRIQAHEALIRALHDDPPRSGG
jgi:hypothetical protein